MTCTSLPKIKKNWPKKIFTSLSVNFLPKWNLASSLSSLARVCKSSNSIAACTYIFYIIYYISIYIIVHGVHRLSIFNIRYHYGGVHREPLGQHELRVQPRHLYLLSMALFGISGIFWYLEYLDIWSIWISGIVGYLDYLAFQMSKNCFKSMNSWISVYLDFQMFLDSSSALFGNLSGNLKLSYCEISSLWKVIFKTFRGAWYGYT